jgi:hypothetical protein
MEIPDMHRRQRIHAMLQANATPTAPDMPRGRAAGIAIAAATVISTIFVALDRSGGGNNALEVLQGIAKLVALKEAVHAVAIASVCAYAFGFTVLARRLGLHRPLVLGGLTTFLIGCVAMVGATIIDGFVTPHIAIDAITHSPERAIAAYDTIRYLGDMLNDLAKLGWVLQAAGALAWSVALMQEKGFDRVIGLTGLVSSALVLMLVVGADTNMSMSSLLGVLVAQLIWNIAAAVLLIRKPREAAHMSNFVTASPRSL